MSYWANIVTSLVALRDHKLRSLLTMLGIIIGVAAVVAMMSLGAGAKKKVTDSVQEVGADLLFILPGAGRGIGISATGQGSAALRERDVRIIMRDVPAIENATAGLQSGVRAVYGNTNYPAPVFGVYPEFLSLQNWQTTAGRSLTDDDVRRGAKVAMIGPRIVEELFTERNPVGATVRLNNTPVEVIGVLSEEGHVRTMAQPSRVVVVPITTLRRRMNGGQGVRPDKIDFIMARVMPGTSLESAQDTIAEALRREKRVAPEDPDPFNIVNLREVLEFQTQVMDIVTLVFAGIASLSLLVGGIGIMNIMLVSVTERRHEIGVRMSVGARAHDITRQFLTESAVLCATGGLIGLFFGALIAAVISRFIELPFVVEAQAVVLALGVSGGIGLFFGYYPARKASALNPIEILRFE